MNHFQDRKGASFVPLAEMMRLMSEAAQHRKQSEHLLQKALKAKGDFLPWMEPMLLAIASQNACLIAGQEAILTALVQQEGVQGQIDEGVTT